MLLLVVYILSALYLSLYPAMGEELSASTPDREIRLQGKVSQSAGQSPLLYGSVQTIPAKTKVDLTVMGNLNSELSQKGDEILAKIACNVDNGGKVLLPGGWFMHGYVTDVVSQRRLGRDGYVEVEFDKILSPNGQFELPFKAKVSTKDKELKAVAKTLLVDAGYVSEGALGGSILSVQLTGLPVAIASHGISVGIGATVGGTLGAIGGLKRKGNIASFFPGDELKIITSDPISLPGFDPKLIPSAKNSSKPNNLNVFLIIHKVKFSHDPLGDKLSRQLVVDVTIKNDTSKDFSFFDLAVRSDHDNLYFPTLTANLPILKQKVIAHTQVFASVTFLVDSSKYEYWLVLLDHKNREEIARVNIN